MRSNDYLLHPLPFLFGYHKLSKPLHSVLDIVACYQLTLFVDCDGIAYSYSKRECYYFFSPTFSNGTDTIALHSKSLYPKNKISLRLRVDVMRLPKKRTYSYLIVLAILITPVMLGIIYMNDNPTDTASIGSITSGVLRLETMSQ